MTETDRKTEQHDGLRTEDDQATRTRIQRKPVDDLYRIREVAELLGVHPRTVARMIDQGKLTAIRLTQRSIRITGAALRECLFEAARPTSTARKKVHNWHQE